MITLQKLIIFILICEQGSLNRAAQAMYLSQSAVSQHIQDLEATLGVTLLKRSPQGTQPTEAGEILLGYARQMLQLLSDAERDIMQIDHAESLHLTLAGTPGINVYILPRWLQDFQTDYAHINLSMQTGLTKEVIAGVMDTRYDFGFVEGQIDDLMQNNFGNISLYDIEYDVTVSASHPLATETLISPDQLTSYPFINRQPTSRTRRWLEHVLQQSNITLKTTTELDSPGTIKYALLNGGGIGILPHYAIERELERGELHRLSIGGLTLTRSLQLVWNQTHSFSVTQRAFLNMLSSVIPHLKMLL